MRRLEDGSIQVDSAYEASKLAIANGFNREADEHKYGLSLDKKPTLASSNEVAFFNKGLFGFSLTPEAMRDMIRFRNETPPPEGIWTRKDWQPPKEWYGSGLTPPGVWQEQKIIIPPKRARVIETVLDAVIEDLSFKELRTNPGLEGFRLDLPRSARVSERLVISSFEASFMMNVLNQVEVEDQDAKQAA